MRFKSAKVGGFQLFAVSGTNTISFGIDFDPAAAAGLLGFAVEREDPTENERYFMYGFKVFASIYPNPDSTLRVLTFDHPIQSFVWDDFTAKPSRPYIYRFYPLKGSPKNLDRSAPPIPISVRTEPLSGGAHDVYFNRGVASSQAYVREFGNRKPDKIADPAERVRALQWLSRDLDEALLGFIDAAQPGDTLLGAFYEFRYRPVANRLMTAIDRGVQVRLVLDAKDNAYTDKKGKFHEAFPREENRRTVGDVGLPAASVIWRERNPDAIAHNKFLVRLHGPADTPAAVWTGSTNLSMGGVHGQTNVGHLVRDAAVAAAFADYWRLLATDPGSSSNQSPAERRVAMATCRTAVAGLRATPTDLTAVPVGTTAVFSPRSGPQVLDFYATLLDQAASLGCITLAFGIGEVFKSRLVQHNQASPLIFMLLEKEDAPRKNATKPFVRIGVKHNVYQAWGGYIGDAVYRWARETNAKRLELNQHVSYIHSKFLLRDPLGPDPVVVTGSANFSAASTNSNDENMLIIRGDGRVADIYFTEFNRLFFHYYFRSIQEKKGTAGTVAGAGAPSLFLDETDGWVAKYAPGTLKTKRLKAFTTMAGAAAG